MALTAKERVIHEHGLVSVLRQLHDDLDAAVASAYGWPEVVAGVNDPGHSAASDEAILTHLCALNAQRAAEERTGQIRWLRPSFQNPTSTATQTQLATGEEFPLVPKVSAALWERIREAELRFGGGGAGSGTAFGAWFAGKETESRRDKRSQSATLTLGTRGPNERANFGNDRAKLTARRSCLWR